MSATTQSFAGDQVSPSVTIHNNRALLCVVMALAVGGWFIAVCSALLGIGSFAPYKSISFAAVMAGASWLLCAYAMWAMGTALWRVGRRAWKNSVTMDANGVQFRYVSAKGVEDFSFPAGKVASVSHKRVGSYQTYTVHGSDGSTFLFTSYTFLRTKHTAKQIAAFCGLQEIQEEK